MPYSLASDPNLSIKTKDWDYTGTGATELLSRMLRLQQQRQQMELSKAVEARAQAAAEALDKQRQLQEAAMLDAQKQRDYTRMKEAAALVDSTTKQLEKVQKEEVKGVPMPQAPAQAPAPVAPQMSPEELEAFQAPAGKDINLPPTQPPTQPDLEPTAAGSAAQVAGAERVDIPAEEGVVETVSQRPPMEFDWGGQIGKVQLPYRDQIIAQEREKKIATGQMFNINSPEGQEALKSMPPGLAAMLKLQADKEGWIDKSGLSGAYGALARTPGVGAHKRVMVDGTEEMLLTDEQIQEYTDAGHEVTGYTPPRSAGEPLVQVPTGETNEYGEPEYEFVPRSQAAGMKFNKPNPTEQKERLTSATAKEAMDENLQTISLALEGWEKVSGLGNKLMSPIKSRMAFERYKNLIDNLAITANKVLGDTSGRYSDVDRAVAANMLGLRSEMLGIVAPGEARTRLNMAKDAMTRMYEAQQRIRPLKPGLTGGAPPPAGGTGIDPEVQRRIDALAGGGNP